ncbi:hypothetical protein [Mangrovimonas sp. TPBH4]|uniref:hypothetical protein n=1 Tax=Mangrovimonas sp. TPBH4 TaxID=1645914 RepID=UPI0006B4050E|nr:hypothetical protein [Mangrovimonas sp. TPBH4]
MKKLLTILILALNICFALGQQLQSKEIQYGNCKEFIFNKKKKDSSIYNINASQLKKLIKCKEKKHTLLFIVNHRCNGILDKMKDIVTMLNHGDMDIMFISIDDDNSKKLYDFRQFFLRIHYAFPVFVISESYSKNNAKKLKLFLNDLNNKGEYKNVGSGSIILLDKNADLIYYSNHNTEYPIEELKQFIY